MQTAYPNVHEAMLHPLTATALLDDRAGHNAQSLALLEALARKGVATHAVTLHYNRWQKLAGLPLVPPLLHLASSCKNQLLATKTDIILGAGRRIAPVLAALKASQHARFSIALMQPPAHINCDLMVVPAHDGVAPAPHRIITAMPLHGITLEALASAKHAWPEGAALPGPRTLVCVGGNTRQIQYTQAQWRDFLHALDKVPGTLMITTSRRTPTEIRDLLRARFPAPHVVTHPERDAHNPYHAMLALADNVIVTGDSLSMLAEATAAQKPLYVFAPSGAFPAKHARMHAAMLQSGYAMTLDAYPTPYQLCPASFEANDVAAQVLEKFAQA